MRRPERLRSLLFTPGQRQKMIDKALGLEPDAVILDLEDGVPPAEKNEARRLVAQALQTPRADRSPVRLVRVNGPGSGRMHEDLEAVIVPGLDGVLLPKVEHPDEVKAAGALIAKLERGKGLNEGSVVLIAAIESARGLNRSSEIATADPRMFGLMFGAEDYALDIGLPVVRVGHAHDMLYARSALANSAAVGRVLALDQVWLDFRDVAGLRADSEVGRELGFHGKCLIHPSQIAVANEVFSPSQGDLELARRIVQAYEEALEAGVGVVMLGGQMVERPIVDRALRMLESSPVSRAPDQP